MTDHSHSHSHAADHEHEHSHPTGFKGFLYGIFVPHSHDAADSIDDAMEANSAGIRALKISLVLMLATTVAQAVVVAFSGSVALLADTIHNFSDALTAVPLWIAFVLSRRAATRRYTYGFNRAEDLAGLFIVLMIALSAVIAAWEAIDRMINPRSMENVGWVIAAGIIGFLGNEAVAVYRIRVGRKIGSAALVADGVHARTDGFTSLAVVAGAIGVLLGFPLADPIVGLLISVMIAVLLIGTIRSVGRRLMDGIEPELVDRVKHALEHAAEVESVQRVRLRWVGHRLRGDAVVRTAQMDLAHADLVAEEAEAAAKRHVPKVDEITIRVTASAPHLERR
ncbi:cation diffusion facilitator family transporter [Arthrobacter sp. AOP36-A1-22]|uniref:cation diffusion facilitator family transporter n=1 Tax=Micrococcales TaxID=85006 RepID=UPI000C55C32E|nr:cation diffusion facilitator family transporter [Brevibacterium sp. 239c]MDN5892443.1 cation diffusion facilitator family transporter [Nocardioides sp.]SMX69629.1 cation diffusion facilitator family transporter [Brevibacterium sp. 239c]